jgi:multidrug efflux pump subunit AcrA (membrane-fusion protein)
MSRPTQQTSSTPSDFAERALGGTPNPLDNIDHVFRHTARRTWLGVIGLAVLLGAGVLWTAVAQQKVTVTASAVMAPRDGVYTAGEAQPGLVTSVTVDEGEEVEQGQVLAKVQVAEGSIVNVMSPVAGRLLTVEVRPGDVAGGGSPMFRIAPPGELMAIAFYPAADVSRLEVGQRVDVAVNGVAPDRFGRAVGRVDFIGPTPISESRLRQITGDSSLLALGQRLGPLREVRITLQKADTPSGVAWDGSDGPTSAIPTGVLAVAEITVGEQTLLERAFD